MLRSLLVSLLFLLLSFGLSAQVERARVSGKVTDVVSDKPIELVTIYVRGGTTAVESAANGRYLTNVPAGEEFELVFSFVGYREESVKLGPLPAGGTQQIDVAMAPSTSDLEVVVRASKIESGGMIRETPEALRLLPSTTGNLESILPHIALGVSSGGGGELTSQYNVRGGNYDENLVYVNDFEIYRPQLIRAGQQEGLTFANIDLIRDLSFSSGGFQSRYGDKLSSVLDIRYKRPDSTRASVGLSFLGGSAHLEGSIKVGKSDFRRLRYLVGTRYKTTRYLLGTLDTEGEYLPNFTDIQGYVTYDISRSLQLGVLANYNRSIYNFTPVTRSTALGLINFALELSTDFSGSEQDDFLTQMGGLSLTYIPEKTENPFFLKFLTSAFRSDENEKIDIIGDYSLRQIESDFGSSDFGETVAELGSGTQQQYVRNFLDIQLYNAEIRGGLEILGDREDATTSHFFQWSVKAQHERINDLINEWERLDSAGFSLPISPEGVNLFQVLKTTNNLESNRFSGFLQDTWTWRKPDQGEVKLSAGVRATYWDLNGEFLLSPRAQLLYKPLGGTKDISYRLAVGRYVQPPFYREMRRPDGTVNTDLKAQRSLHFVGGLTSDFYYGKRNPKKFRFIMEAYYKQLRNLVSYEIENVRIDYSGENDAEGYVAGIDLRLNGEFVPGADSWVNLSLIQAKEKLLGVEHRQAELGSTEGEVVEFVPRPTEQVFQLSVFFQDYLRSNENFRTHVNLTVGGGLPFGVLDNNEVFRNTYRFDTYHRIDIGFSWRLFDRLASRNAATHPLRFTRSTFLSLEVFNLMQVSNQAGNTWIKTIFQQQYAIPNRLTGRRLNLRLRMEF
ncbi:TonB-dependent receptor [Lewinellaceae bacterium SD302]|nr:TonB-dependent receptor [Lewinellaceae bacterium SD302]